MPKGKQGRIRTSYLYSVRRRRRIIQARRDQQRMQNEVHALPDPDAADFPEDDDHLFHQVIENDNQAPPRNHHHDNACQYKQATKPRLSTSRVVWKGLSILDIFCLKPNQLYFIRAITTAATP